MATVRYNDFMLRIQDQQASIPAVVAIKGDEAFLRSEALKALENECHQRGFLFEHFNYEHGSAEELFRSLRTQSLFGEKRALLVKNIRIGQQQEVMRRFKDEFLTYLEQPSKSQLLIIDGQHWDGNSSVARRIKKEHLVVECLALKPWQKQEAGRLVEERAALKGLKFHQPGLAIELYEACSGNLGLVEQELAKFELILEARIITKADFKELLSHQGYKNVFELCEAILFGFKEEALRESFSLFQEKDLGGVMRFLGLLESQLRKLGKLWYLLQTRAQSPGTALAQAGYNPRSPKNKDLLSLCRRLALPDFQTFYALLYELDLRMKRGRAQEIEILVPRFIARLASVTKKD